MPLPRLRDLFTIAAVEPRLALAHLAALKQQVPFLYLIIAINSSALASTHVGTAPLGLVIGPVVALCAVSATRAVFWWRLDLSHVPPDRFVPMLRQTNLLTAVLSPTILLWALSMEWYDTSATDLHILFFLALTSIGCIFCLTHLRSAALIIAASVLGPAAGVALHARDAELTVVAINLGLVGLVILRILAIQHRDFVARARQAVRLEELGEQNLRLAATDMLTGLPNRRTFFPALDRMIAAADPFLLAVIDLDGFKAVNDSFGHVAGDRVLAEVAGRLEGALPPGTLLARIGGDEFAIMARDDDAALMSTISQAVCRMVEVPIRYGDVQIRIGASTGIAHWVDGQSATDLFERADYAMYQAKGVGGSATLVFTAEHETAMCAKGAIEAALRSADLDAELTLVFQPIVDIDQQTTVAFEALARWQSPAVGRVPPDQFITAAERMGIISDITLALLRRLLATMAKWPTDVVVSFNLSTADIISPMVVDSIVALIEGSGIEALRLHFEVTETAMLEDFSGARTGLERLKALGCALSLDDFGTGHSSLSHVHHLPVDNLKVDGSFTRHIVTHDTARSIVASIIGLGHGLRLQCIVEGVETVEQMVLLRGLGCRLMQGYLFQKPLPANEVVGYLNAERTTSNEAESVVLRA